MKYYRCAILRDLTQLLVEKRDEKGYIDTVYKGTMIFDSFVPRSRREAKLKIGLGRCIRYSIDVLMALGQVRLRIIRNGTRCWECCFSNRLRVALVSNKYTRIINKLSR